MKKTTLAALIFCSAALGATSVPFSARAFDKNLVSNVKYRYNPYYQSEGGRLGTFIVKPAVMLLQTYDDNIFREHQADSDNITVLRPEVRIMSDWGLHGIEAGAQGSFGRYAEFTSENYNDFSFYVSGQYDVDYETYFKALAKYEKRHQERDQLEDPGGDEPVEYGVKTVFIGFTRELSVLRVNASATHRDITYEDSSVGNTIIDNSTRDRSQQELDLRIAYGISDNYEAFIAGGYDRRRYDVASADFRDSDSYNLRAGVAVNFTGKLRGDIYAGYIWQNFDSGFEDVGAVKYGGSLLWNVTDLTSIEAGVDRSLIETVQAGASSIVQTNVDLSVAHSLRDNILVEGTAGFIDNSYEGSGSNDNHVYRAGMSVVYKPNEHVSTGVKYDYINRKFESASRDYDNNRVMVNVRYDY
ncbi:MAG: outer membrane beta-barrel protein [Alphaproteobacteria bacterium]|nr:outer membrane beta-barrel protein [Alphaproteobacteria bacterium]MCB1838943.1 outer membrane beta-barrel protein [Alphaproteobacteria bacterium]